MFKRFWWMFLVMLPAGAFAGFLVAAVFTYIMPKMYESEAVIEVQPLPFPEENAERPMGMDSRFLDTARETIVSRNSLEKVVNAMELDKRWNVDREMAVQILKSAVVTQNIKGTDLISIRVRHTSKVDARDIAAGLANGYKESRAKIQWRETVRNLRKLNRAVREQEDRVEERRKVLAKIPRLRRPLYHPGEPVIGADDETLPNPQNHADAKREFEVEQELLQSLKIKQMGWEVAARVSRGSVVIHEDPVIAETPVSPNVTLNLLLGTAAGILLSPLMAMFLIWIMARLMPTKLVEV